jgi:hypothetical protein
MSNPLDLDALQALADAATPGPWCTQAWGDFPPDGMDRPDMLARSISTDDDESPEFVLVSGENAVNDAWFLAAAREAVPALIERVRELEAELADSSLIYEVGTLRGRVHALASKYTETYGLLSEARGRAAALEAQLSNSVSFESHEECCAASAAAERAAIVAWLRHVPAGHAMPINATIADAIEAGEHIKERG